MCKNIWDGVIYGENQSINTHTHTLTLHLPVCLELKTLYVVERKICSGNKKTLVFETAYFIINIRTSHTVSQCGDQQNIFTYFTNSETEICILTGV